MGQAVKPRKRIITTRHSYRSTEQLHRYLSLYESIGYKRLKGRRVPNGTKHKLCLIFDHRWYILYHE